MENPCDSSLENYGVHINDLWHISYAIKLWLNVVFESFVMGLTLGWWILKKRHELHYSSLGFDFVGSGGHGGRLIAPRKTWARNLKHWS